MRRLLALVLAATLAAGCAALRPASEGSGSLRLFAYNIRHGEGLDGKIDLDRIARIIASHEPDLVALQEVDQCCARTGGRDLAAELGELLGMEHRFGKFMDYQGGEYGLAVLSRLPIRGTIRHALPPGGEPRCALEVQVEAPGFPSPVSFVSIHSDYTRDEKFRVAQVRTLLDALKDRTNPVVLAGDFNARPEQESMRMLRDANWRVLPKNRPGGSFTIPSDLPRSEIDYLVIRNFPPLDVEHWVVDERVASDHRPIAAVFSRAD